MHTKETGSVGNYLWLKNKTKPWVWISLTHTSLGVLRSLPSKVFLWQMFADDVSTSRWDRQTLSQRPGKAVRINVICILIPHQHHHYHHNHQCRHHHKHQHHDQPGRVMYLATSAGLGGCPGIITLLHSHWKFRSMNVSLNMTMMIAIWMRAWLGC